VINTTDVLVLKKYILGMGYLNEEQSKVADISEDGSVNIIDMVALKNILNY
jgi:hypothetical protein